jgi:4-hydroxybenzoate polyprenyltransferase
LLIPGGLHLAWQTRRLDIEDAQRCLCIFRSNRDTGLLFAAAVIATSWLR